jgi:hypothetical protein
MVKQWDACANTHGDWFRQLLPLHAAQSPNWYHFKGALYSDKYTEILSSWTYDNKHLFHWGSFQRDDSNQVCIGRSWYPPCCLDSSGIRHLPHTDRGCLKSGGPCPPQGHICTPQCAQNSCKLEIKVPMKIFLLSFKCYFSNALRDNHVNTIQYGNNVSIS